MPRVCEFARALPHGQCPKWVQRAAASCSSGEWEENRRDTGEVGVIGMSQVMGQYREGLCEPPGLLKSKAHPG